MTCSCSGLTRATRPLDGGGRLCPEAMGLLVAHLRADHLARRGVDSSDLHQREREWTKAALYEHLRQARREEVARARAIVA